VTDDNSKLLNFSVTCRLLVGRARGNVLSAAPHLHSGDIHEALIYTEVKTHIQVQTSHDVIFVRSHSYI